MGTFSDRMTQTARRLLTKYGQPVTAVKDNTSDVDPTTGTVTETPSDTTYQGYGYPSQFKDNQIDGTLIKRSDTRLIFATNTTPEVNDIITISGVTHTALNVQKINAQGNNIVYIVQCRVM